jgi:hypothetical protein
MKRKILAVFGDESFPRLGKGSLPKRRQTASDNIISFFRSIGPEIVYMIPTPGTCAYACIVCSLLKIPFVLVSPFPGYFDGMNSKDKDIMEEAVSAAKTVIILNENPIDRKKAWEEAVEFLSSVTNVIAFLYNRKGPKSYQKFMDEYNFKYFNDKLLLELPYDDGKMLSE